MSLAAKPCPQQVSIRSDAEIEFTNYPYDIPFVRELGHLKFHPDVTFFAGENGSGKSTILEGIAIALAYGPEGGTKNVQLKTTESVSPLHRALRSAHSFKKPADGYFLRAESIFNVATYMDGVGYLGGYDNRSLHSRLHGEAFMAPLTHKFRGYRLYLLDEPEAALSPNRQLAALSAIHQAVQNESQFIIATHSPILLSYPRAKIVQFDGSGISEVKYEDTEHFALTRDFLKHYPRRLEQLLADE